MVSKSFIAYTFLLCFTASVNAHAGVSPALGVQGALIRADVQRPSTSSPCGNVNIAQSLDSSSSVAAALNDTFSVNATGFDAGSDGSRSIKTVQIDASGTGQNFVPATMLVNGNADPASAGTDQLTVQLPEGTTCTGGTSKNICIASFETAAGFGNCVAVTQGQGATSSSTSSGTKAAKDAAPASQSDPAKRSYLPRRNASFKRNWASRDEEFENSGFR